MKQTNTEVLARVKRFLPYGHVIHEIDPTVNPVGIENHLVCQYGTLDHMSHERFAEEIVRAKRIERACPGYLRECCHPCEALYDEVQTILDQAVLVTVMTRTETSTAASAN